VTFTTFKQIKQQSPKTRSLPFVAHKANKGWSDCSEIINYPVSGTCGGYM